MRTFTASKATIASPRRAAARAIIVAAAGLTLAVGIAVPTASSATLADKQAQAAELDQQVAKLEDRYGDLQERWRGALVELREIQSDVRDARAKLKIARRDLRGAKGRLEDRALAIYRDGGGSTELQQVAEAGSFEDFFNRLETIERVGDQDASILERVRSAAERVAEQEQRLEQASVKQAKVVKRADRSKQKMKKVLGEKQEALASVTADIVAIMEAQRAAAAARDAELARAAAAALGTGGTGPSGTAGGDAAAPSVDGGPAPSSSDTSSDDGGSDVAVSVPLPPASGSAASAASIAVGKSGSPYSFGAAGPSSFDCSGLVVWAFGQAGRPGLPHSTYSLIGMGVEVPLSQAQVGDLVFTNNSGHMGIYVGGGSFVHAPRTGRTVTVESLGNYSVVAVRRI
jgi:cell wall-associated NlpC family hydrolase